jgi:hypothetical protein
MKISQQGGFTAEELLEYRPIIYSNVVEVARSVVMYMHRSGIECKEATNKVLTSHLSTSPPIDDMHLATRGEDSRSQPRALQCI